MKNKIKSFSLVFTALFAYFFTTAQNVSINMLVLNGGLIPTGGTGTLQATINATTGTAGQSSPVAAGKINVQITVPPSLLISTTQNLPTGWTIRNNNGTVINICNSTGSLAVNTAVDLPIELQGVTATTGSPTISGQISFRTNCSAPGSLAGDNPSDNTGQAGFTVAGTVPVKLTQFNVLLNNCKPSLRWNTEREFNFNRYEIERSNNALNWFTVGVTTAANNNFNKNTYSFNDNSVVTGGRLFYRLKMIDNDGRYSYSETLPVFINCDKLSIDVFPNPVTTKKLFVSITGAKQKAEALLTNVLGQQVLKTYVNNGTSQLDVSGIATGEYILIVSTETSRQTFKVIVQN